MKNKYYGIILLATFILAITSAASARTLKTETHKFVLYHQKNGIITFEGKVQQRAAGVEGSFRMVMTTDPPVIKKKAGSVSNITIKETPKDVMRQLSTFSYKLPNKRDMKHMGSYPVSDTVIVVEAQIKKPTDPHGIPDFIFKSIRLIK